MSVGISSNGPKPKSNIKQEQNTNVKPAGDEAVKKPEEPKNKGTSGLSNQKDGFIG